MAKSLRSKFKRKMRRLKRAKIEARQLKKLQAAVSDLNATEAMEIVEDSVAKPEADTQVKTESSGGLNLKTLRRPNGSYPVWVSQRKVRKLKRLFKSKKAKSRR
uniref:Ribosome biogenesis protein NSA2 homolog n=1 Tax=Syphacia muris TaxID=451379 RepID=A0A0N5AEQ9_9BILA